MKTIITNIEYHFFNKPTYNDSFILVAEENNTQIAVYNIYSQKLGNLPKDKNKEVLFRMRG